MKTDKETVEAIEKVQKQDDLITLSTGVVLRAKQAPPLVLIEVMSSFPRPKPPVYHNEKMGREIENPDDPDYIERVKSWEMESSKAVLNALIILGTELVSKPKGFAGPGEQKWMDEYSMFGVPMHPQNETWRYLTWVKYKAVQNEKDLEAIREVVGRLSGVRDSSVKSAEEFPGRDAK